jgi:DNA-binding NarL/FixJ family response regulator
VRASLRGDANCFNLVILKGASSGGVQVKVIRRSEAVRAIKESHPATPNETYFFYDKNTGAAHFQVQAGPDGRFPVDQAAGLLAMHCMVRGQSPSDYLIMVQADQPELEELSQRATKLLEAGRSVKSGVRLTRREEEVLDGVLRSLANKEIAAALNLSERTVKFHVSSLLAKYRVRGRMELIREAARHSFALPTLPAVAGTEPTKHVAARIPSYRRLAPRATVLPLSKSQLLA